MKGDLIKVAVLAERLGTGAGGTEVYEKCLLTALMEQELEARGVRVYPVLARTSALDALPDSVRPACRVLKPGGKLGTLLATGRLVKNLDVDVFHACFVTPPLPRDIPVVATVHDLGFLRHKEHYPRMLAWRLTKTLAWTLRRADTIVTVSDSTRSDLLSLPEAPAQNVVTIHNGIDRQFVWNGGDLRASGVLAQSGIREPYILYTGRLEPRKNVPVLIDAYDLLRSSGRFEGQLVMLGARRTFLCEAAVERIGKSPYRDDIVQPGHVPDGAVSAFYAGARVLAFVSLYEGFGFPALEAMANGLPVVCSHVTSLPEIVGDAALLVDPHDAVAVADALARAVNDESLRRELIARGLRRAAEFTWHRAAELFLDLYCQMAERRVRQNGRRAEGI